MEVLNLCDDKPKEDLIARVNRLQAGSQARWGKMNVSQMLAHLQMPMAVALGDHKLKSNIILRFLGSMMKSKLYDNKPFKQGLPTAPSFRITNDRDFEAERSKAIEFIRRFNDQNIRNTVHPVFGNMTKEQWGKANWKHIDHHLRQFGV